MKISPKALMMGMVTAAFLLFVCVIFSTMTDQKAMAITFSFFMCVYMIAMLMLALGKVQALSLDVEHGKIDINQPPAKSEKKEGPIVATPEQ